MESASIYHKSKVQPILIISLKHRLKCALTGDAVGAST